MTRGESTLRRDLTDAACTQLQAFIDLRRRWGRTHDLAGPAAELDPWGVDIGDGVAASEAVREGTRLVDVGSGGGVPGLVVAILRPELAIVLVEPRVKRTAFLRAAKRELGLSQVEVVRGRWPDVGSDLLGPLQLISRAVVAPMDWPKLAVSGSADVVAVLRMLAQDRPEFTLDGFHLGKVVDYERGHGVRRVERWDRVSRETPPISGDRSANVC